MKLYQDSTENLMSNEIHDMLNEHLNIDIDIYEHLSETQKKAFELFKNGKNILLIGEAGMGKSFCIKTFKEYNDNKLKKTMYVTSTTGISAYSIKGVTIHSLLGIGTGEMDIDSLIKKVYRKKVFRDRIINMDILILDEASMLSCELFQKLNTLCQVIRKNKKFFGGIQMIFSMDPLQLLPVFNNTINLQLGKDIDERLIIESDVFNKEFTKNNIMLLTENFRQQNDPTFINLLSRIRDGSFTNDDINILNKRKILPVDISKHIHLVTSNKKAQVINENELNKISNKSIKYKSSFSTSGVNDEIKDLLKKELEYQFKQKGINELILKKNARVMLIKNLDTKIGLVNGALGTIIDLNESNITVEFDGDNKIRHNIEAVDWELEIDGCKVKGVQMPIMLAYSITVHKSQSITLDSAILDLADCFCEHQVYTALSRLRSLDGMYLKSFNSSKIKVNQKMKEFYNKIS